MTLPATPSTLRARVLSVLKRTDDWGLVRAGILSGDTPDGVGRGEVKMIGGDLAFLDAGQEFEASGRWTNTETYGWSFRVASATAMEALVQVRDMAPSALIDLIVSLRIPKVGEATATKLVCGLPGHSLPDLLDPQQDDEARTRADAVLLRILPPAALERLRKGWADAEGLRKVFAFFSAYGLPSAICRLLYRAHKTRAIAIAEKDPYLLTRGDGVGFKTSDKVARAMGVAVDDPRRLRGALVYLCAQAKTQEGHTAVITKAARHALWKVLSDIAEDEEERQAVHRALEDHYLDVVHDYVASGDGKEVFVGGEAALVDSEIYVQERVIADYLLLSTVVDEARAHSARWQEYGSGVDAIIEDLVARTTAATGFLPDDEQIAAVAMALTRSTSVLTGGPGTGKTTVLRLIVECAQRMGLSVLLMAPTGKAARRMSEAIGQRAMTIHRALGLIPGAYTHRPVGIDETLVIVDEASMLDVYLAYRITRELGRRRPGRHHLLFVGDVDQLPSVGCGRVLSDIIDSGHVPVTRLTTVHRQAEGSDVVYAAHAINKGNVPTADLEGRDFLREPVLDLEDTVEKWLDLGKALAVENAEDVQILVPVYQGDFGINAVNRAIQRRFTERNEQVRGTDVPLFIGDRVIQLRNDYELGVVNGDMGRITGATPKEILITFDGIGPVVYPREQLLDLAPGYAISIHKSQGSEWLGVLVLLHRSHNLGLQRRSIYTAVTRAKRRCLVIAGDETFRRALANDVQALRLTLLGQWIAEGYQEALTATRDWVSSTGWLDPVGVAAVFDEDDNEVWALELERRIEKAFAVLRPADMSPVLLTAMSEPDFLAEEDGGYEVPF